MLDSISKKTAELYIRFERPLSSISLVGGFIFDAITLQRVDEFWENIWVLGHLLIAAVCIILINRKRIDLDKPKEELEHLWILVVMQFMFGGLLSTFLVYYFRSGSILVSWPFILLLAVAFGANERLRHHYARIVFQISFYSYPFSLSLFLFCQ